ncbi:MAG: SDR family oxidoreductase [Promethearchaeota archaeon]
MVSKQGYFKNRTAIVTGGSSGIGKAIAKRLVSAGTSVAIIARNKNRLEDAKGEIEALIKDKDTFIDIISCDVTIQSQVENAIKNFISNHSVPFFLFNCAGMARPDYIENYKLQDFIDAMNINYFGTIIPTITLLPHFIEKKEGHFVNISSGGGIVGLIGYGTYAPSKFAIIGFSEVLRHEMKVKNIDVSVVCPNDVDTPGFKEENKTKPEENKILSERGKLVSPETVADHVIRGVAKKKFMIFPPGAAYVYNMKRLFPSLVLSVLDSDLKKAMKKLGKL